jgi:hypothetical protein
VQEKEPLFNTLPGSLLKNFAKCRGIKKYLKYRFLSNEFYPNSSFNVKNKRAPSP